MGESMGSQESMNPVIHDLHGKSSPTGPPKSITLRVGFLESKYEKWFYRKSEIWFQAKLGSGETVSIKSKLI
jgi:hypothetical protein